MNQATRIIRKYPNRRLYDTATSSYITLVDVRRLILDGVEVLIEDARTREDLTRSVFLQIIMDEEVGRPLFSVEALTRLIRCHGKPMHGVIGACLERNLQMFGEYQDEMLPGEPVLASGDLPELDDAQGGDEQALQHLVSRCMEQTAHLFGEMQSRNPQK